MAQEDFALFGGIAGRDSAVGAFPEDVSGNGSIEVWKWPKVGVGWYGLVRWGGFKMRERFVVGGGSADVVGFSRWCSLLLGTFGDRGFGREVTEAAAAGGSREGATGWDDIRLRKPQ